MLRDYTKKPITIQAVQLTMENAEDIIKMLHADGFTEARFWTKPPMRAISGIIVPTLESPHEAGFGDWIIKGVKGEYYPCKDDIFRNNHEGFDEPKTSLTDTVPEGHDHRELKDNGQQLAYVVLTEEERAKGFVRPYRDAYVHVGVGGHEIDPNDMSKHGRTGSACGTLTRIRGSIAETYARDPSFYSGTFCAGCGKHLPLEEFVWDGTNEQVGS